MERHLKITVGLLLLVQALHPAAPQDSTDSPGRTIDPSWLRNLGKRSPNNAVADEEAEYGQFPDGMASGGNDSDLMASGFMAVRTEEENNVAGNDLTNETSLTALTTPPMAASMLQTEQPNADVPLNTTAAPGGLSQLNGTEAENGLPNSKKNGRDQLTNETSPGLIATTVASTLQPEKPNATIPASTTATAAPGGDSSRINGTEAENGLHNSKKNGRDQLTNETSPGLIATTVASTLQPEKPNATIPASTTATAGPGGDSSRINGTKAENGLPNSTAATSQIPTTQNSTSVPENTNRTDIQTTTLALGANGTQGPTTRPGEVPRLPNTTESTNTTKSTNATTATTATTETTTPVAPIPPERTNRSNSDADEQTSSDRGLSKDGHLGHRKGAWGAILGIGVAVALVGLVAYVVLKKRIRTGFSHSKLVEEYPSDPVLRLDNAAPLDLDFGLGGSAYYNRGLQKDSIQMDNIPGRR